jgi:hypothetical protein
VTIRKKAASVVQKHLDLGWKATLTDKRAGDKHLAADAVAKAQAILSEPELLPAMFDVR